jgi:hypothetical protein
MPIKIIKSFHRCEKKNNLPLENYQKVVDEKMGQITLNRTVLLS